MSDAKVDVVVLAGGDGVVIDEHARFKGLVPIAGKPMVEWVVDALIAASSVHEVAVVVPTAEDLGSWADRAGKIVVSDGRFADNILAGIESFRTDRPVLLVTGDIPTLTPEAVDDFVARALERDADFAYPLVSREDVLEQYPGSERTFFKLKTGRFTGGNITMVAPVLARRSRELGQKLFELRKSPVKTVRLLGLRFAVDLMLGRLDPADVEVKATELLGGKGVAIVTRHASIGADVDKPADVIVTERVLYERLRASRAGGQGVE